MKWNQQTENNKPTKFNANLGVLAEESRLTVDTLPTILLLLLLLSVSP